MRQLAGIGKASVKRLSPSRHRLAGLVAKSRRTESGQKKGRSHHGGPTPSKRSAHYPKGLKHALRNW